MRPIDSFIEKLPKAELHLHVEGTLEPELAFELAERNGVRLPWASAEELRAAYRFRDLRSFLDLYYAVTRVLVRERDFYDLTRAYLNRISQEAVLHAEVSFDPQAHTQRGVPFDAVVTGIHEALRDGKRELGVDSRLILCFLRDRGVEEAHATLEQALRHRDRIAAVGLDSAELGHPPERFRDVFARARGEGFRAVAHAGEEGPPSYVWQALEALRAERIDHGIRSLEDEALVRELAERRVPLTVCPLSNARLGVVEDLKAHPLREMLERGLVVTLNSDDPAYFGGYLNENYRAVERALGLGRDQLVRIAGDSFRASFLEASETAALLARLDAYVAGARAEAGAGDAPGVDPLGRASTPPT
jgi:adenosine deaminase